MTLDLDRLHTQWIAETPEDEQNPAALTEYLKQQQNLQTSLLQPRESLKDAKIVPFEPVREPWSEYTLADYVYGLILLQSKTEELLVSQTTT